MPRLRCASSWRSLDISSQRTADTLSLRSPMMDTFTRALRRSGDMSTSTIEISWFSPSGMRCVPHITRPNNGCKLRLNYMAHAKDDADHQPPSISMRSGTRINLWPPAVEGAAAVMWPL